MSSPTTGIVFLHGAGLRSSIWDDIKPLISLPAMYAEFPGREQYAHSNCTLSLEDYSKTIINQIKELNTDRIVLVVHSISGILGLKIAETFKNRLAGFIAIAALIPEKGGSFVSCFSFFKQFILKLMLFLFGTRPPEVAIKQGLCNDLSEETGNMIANSFVPESKGLYLDACKSPIPNVPSIYIRLTNDNELDIQMQDTMMYILNPKQTASIKSGHLPMKSKPVELANIINKFVSSLH